MGDHEASVGGAEPTNVFVDGRDTCQENGSSTDSSTVGESGVTRAPTTDAAGTSSSATPVTGSSTSRNSPSVAKSTPEVSPASALEGGRETSNKILYVGNLHKSVSDEQLKDVFTAALTKDSKSESNSTSNTDEGSTANSTAPSEEPSTTATTTAATNEPDSKDTQVGEPSDTTTSKEVSDDVDNVNGSEVSAIQTIKILNDKNKPGFNYAFIEFINNKAAETAMGALQGALVNNAELKINWAFQSSNVSNAAGGDGSEQSPSYNIFVGDLSPEVDDESLQRAFSKFASLKSAHVMWDMQTSRSRGYGFVSFAQQQDAELALQTMNGEWVCGRAIRCNWASHKQMNGANGTNNGYRGGNGGRGGGHNGHRGQFRQYNGAPMSAGHLHVGLGGPGGPGGINGGANGGSALGGSVGGFAAKQHYQNQPYQQGYQPVQHVQQFYPVDQQHQHQQQQQHQQHQQHQQQPNQQQHLQQHQHQQQPNQQQHLQQQHLPQQHQHLQQQQQLPDQSDDYTINGAGGAGANSPFAPTNGMPVMSPQSYDIVLRQTPSWQTTVYLGNIAHFTQQGELIPLLQNFGFIVDFKFHPERGCAFVKYDSHERAALAIVQLAGFNVNGRPLKCGWGKDRPPMGQYNSYRGVPPQMYQRQ
ncbi:hypothetical protein CAAN3_08S06040 [[Candida] anglica]